MRVMGRHCGFISYLLLSLVADSSCGTSLTVQAFQTVQDSDVAVPFLPLSVLYVHFWTRNISLQYFLKQVAECLSSHFVGRIYHRQESFT